MFTFYAIAIYLFITMSHHSPVTVTHYNCTGGVAILFMSQKTLDDEDCVSATTPDGWGHVNLLQPATAVMRVTGAFLFLVLY